MPSNAFYQSKLVVLQRQHFMNVVAGLHYVVFCTLEKLLLHIQSLKTLSVSLFSSESNIHFFIWVLRTINWGDFFIAHPSLDRKGDDRSVLPCTLSILRLIKLKKKILTFVSSITEWILHYYSIMFQAGCRVFLLLFWFGFFVCFLKSTFFLRPLV